jgi:hypothetical protein
MPSSRRREGSDQLPSGQYEAKRCRWCCSAAQPRAMQAAAATRGNHRLRLPGMGDDPRHDRPEVSALGEDRGTLDHLAARGVRTRQPLDQRANRIVVHNIHLSRSASAEPGAPNAARNLDVGVGAPAQHPARKKVSVLADEVVLATHLARHVAGTQDCAHRVTTRRRRRELRPADSTSAALRRAGRRKPRCRQ